MNTNEEVVLDVKPEDVVNEGVNVEAPTDMPINTTPKFDAKKGLLIVGLTLTGLAAGYGVYKGVKWFVGKRAEKKAAKVESESKTTENTEEK